MMGAEWTVIRSGSAWYWGQDGKLHEAGANEPVFEFDPVTGKSLGLRVEGQNTYPLLWSEDFSNSYWNKAGSTVATVADDRFGVKYLLSVNSSSGAPGVRRTDALVAHKGIPATLNLIFERHEDFSGIIWFGNYFEWNSGITRIIFDFGREVISSVGDTTGQLVDYGSQKLGNGVYHLWLSFLNREGSNSGFVVRRYTSGYVGNVCYLIKAWINFGTNPVSYCKTEGSIVTRPADIITRSIDHYNPEQGTWVISVDALNSVVAKGIGFDTARFNGQGVVVYAYDNSGGRLYLNGQQALVTPKPGTPLALQFSATVRQFTKYLRYYPVSFSDEKCKELATGAVTMDWLFDGDEILHLDYLGQDYGYRSADDALIVARDNSLVDIPVTSFTRAGSGWVMGPNGAYSEAGIDVPRFQYAPTGEAEGLLVEPQATNRIAYSSDFSNPYWNVFGGTISQSGEEFGLPVYRFREDSTTGGHGITVTSAPFSSGLTARVRWALVRPVGRGVALDSRSTAGSHGVGVFLNHVSKKLTFSSTTSDAGSQSLGDWQLLSFYHTSSSNNVGADGGFGVKGALGLGSSNQRYQGEPDAGFDIVFCQAEVGFVATSPIPTNGTSITRPADVYVSDLDELPSYSGDVGTIVITLKEPQFLAYPFLLAASTTDPTDEDHIRVDRESDGTLYLVAQDSEGSDATTPDPADKPTDDTVYKLGIRWSGGDIAMCVNGGGVRKLTNISPAGLRYLILGNGQHALLHKATYTRRAVGDAELQNLTTVE